MSENEPRDVHFAAITNRIADAIERSLAAPPVRTRADEKRATATTLPHPFPAAPPR